MSLEVQAGENATWETEIPTSVIASANPTGRGSSARPVGRSLRTGADRRRPGISVAVAEQPDGPFHDTSLGPFVFQRDRGGSIDPSPFVDLDGRVYLLWKSDDNALGRPPSIWASPSPPMGLPSPAPPTELMRHDWRL